MRIVVLAQRGFGSGISDRGLGAGHEDPLFEALVICDLDLATFEATFIEHGGLADVADVEDVTLLENVAAVSDGHHLHFAVARLAASDVGEDLHVADVHAAIEVGDAVWAGVAVVVGESGKR
jgi:hypothetical protein